MVELNRLAFVDVETTGMSPNRDRIIEVAIIRVHAPDDGHGPPWIRQFNTLVAPGIAVPPEIRFLTGIDDSRLDGAPRFDQVADTVRQWLEGAQFVAHQARFDHGFLKAEFARCSMTMSADPLCTVRLSRALSPQRTGHGLDTLIRRHDLGPIERHTASGDALAIWRLWLRWAADHGVPALTAAATRLLARPTLPAHLGLESVKALPTRPGIYAFLGANGQPLYVGKSLNLRERVPAHFAADHRSERGLRLASETRELRWQTCAGEFGALLAEALAIGHWLPAHNRALRRVTEPVALVMSQEGKTVSVQRWQGTSPAGSQPWAGPFSSRRQARSWLMTQARAAGLCMATLGLERVAAGRACFAHQLGRCAGACIDERQLTGHRDTLTELLASACAPRWPSGCRLVLHEQAASHDEQAWHLFADWRWLGTTDDETRLPEMLALDTDETCTTVGAFARAHSPGTPGHESAAPCADMEWVEHSRGEMIMRRPVPGAQDIRIHRLLRQWLTPAIEHLAATDDCAGDDLPLPPRRRRDRCRYRLSLANS